MMKNLLTITFLTLCFVTFGQKNSADKKVPQKISEVQSSQNNKMYSTQGDINSDANNVNDNNFSSTVFSTDGVHRGCGFEIADQMLRERNPGMPSIDEFEEWMKTQIKQREQQQQSQVFMLDGPRCDVMYIPYVVHVLHEGEAVNTVGNVVGQNVSAAQVQSQIDVLNEAYRKMNFDRNDSPMWDYVSADFQIQFVPAMYNPDTDEVLAEPGINRINLVEEGLPTTFNSVDAVFNAFQNQIKPATIWDPELVLNMWIVDFFQSSGGLLGYAQFPSASGLPGLNADGGLAETDGVVMSSNAFLNATVDDGSFMTPGTTAFSQGHTTTHEIGHWVGLRHIWGDGDCTADDFVTDTPNSGGPSNGCNINQDSCTADDMPDMVQNYMDYSDDNCMSLFTEGQKARKEVVFDLSPRRGSLLNSPVGDYPNREPYVFIEVDDLRKELVEADGCGAFTDYMIRPRMKDCTDGMGGNITATISVDDMSTVTADDYDFPMGQTVTFDGNGPEVLELPIRIYSDGVTEGDETLIVNISIDANGSDAVVHPNDLYTQAIWTVKDAIVPEDPAVVSFSNIADDIELPETCANGDMNLQVNLDNFPEETSWSITNDMDMVVASGGTYENEADGTTLNIPITLAPGNYTLNVFDDWGDGFGNGGEIVLTDSTGAEFASISGDFGTEISATFCVSSGAFTFNGIIPIDATVKEVENCGDEYAEYYVAINIADCVSGEQDVTATITVDATSTATEGADFVFPSGKTVTFNGTGAQTLTVPIRFLGDNVAEGNETLILNLSVDNEDIVNLGTTTTSITILDTDIPLLTIASVESVREAEYNCDNTSNLFEVTVTADGCPADNIEVMFSLIAADGTVAMEGDDFNFVGSNTYTFNLMNIEEPASFMIEVFDDSLIEGDEPLWLGIALADQEAASVVNAPYEVIIQDPQGVVAPTLFDVVNENFEGGLPNGWTIVESADTAPNTWVVSENTALNGMAAHITNDTGAKPLSYDATTTGEKDVYLISPLFDVNSKLPIEMLFQVEGEPGFFGAFDFGAVGIVGEDTDITNTDEIINNLFGFLLISEPNPITLTEYLGGQADLQQIYEDAGFAGNQARLVFLWRSDFSIQNSPPLAVDDVSVVSGNFIETDKMLGMERPSYPITADQEIYYYNTVNSESAMMVLSSSDHGCSSGYVYQAGTGIQQFISEYLSEYAAEKTFAVVTENPDLDASTDIGLYFTEEELAGWESATGNSRDNLYMIKTDGYALGTCYDSNVKLELILDNFPGETSWELIDDNSGAIIETGSGYGTAGAVITANWDLPEGDYTFNIYDDFGDGICCAFGNGSYTLSSGVEIIAEGGAFDDVDSVSFCVSDSDLDLCNDYRDIEFAPVTITPVVDGYQLRASFESGLGEFTGFAISAIPSFTPGEFTAVQNQEQVEVTFTNKYDEANIEYYIFEKLDRNLDWVELETITANGSGTYTVIDYFPYVGINRYRVGAVLSNGDVVYPCYEAEVFFESTNDFDITPNPAVNDITIVISDSNIEGPMSLGIYDEYGRMVYNEDLNSYAGIVRHNINIANLAVGEYYVIVKNELGFQKHGTFIKTAN